MRQQSKNTAYLSTMHKQCRGLPINRLIGLSRSFSLIGLGFGHLIFLQKYLAQAFSFNAQNISISSSNLVPVKLIKSNNIIFFKMSTKN